MRIRILPWAGKWHGFQEHLQVPKNNHSLFKVCTLMPGILKPALWNCSKLWRNKSIGGEESCFSAVRRWRQAELLPARATDFHR
ncbi:hypothetical protein SPSYN_02562 [Sporotomaculum syntrophicum]|uniref:Uncharacterized protein n=1 Tax=Sporotomaculum syntrophicum TaxID=182264 RepID=A0A9D2WMX9_9FIRM|nr:hypothetical protein SPSYN_02562 [Sporotomaculum syntrophicum]